MTNCAPMKPDANMPNPEIERLSTEEIQQMATYLEKFPPVIPPPVGLPFFDVRRIAATLLLLTTTADNYAISQNRLAKAMAPFVAWAEQILTNRDGERETSVPDYYTLFRANDADLTVGDLRVLVALAGKEDGTG